MVRSIAGRVGVASVVKARRKQGFDGLIRFGFGHREVQIAQHPSESVGILIWQQGDSALEQDRFDAGLIEDLHGVTQHRAQAAIALVVERVQRR